jgi:hypothetical protein
VKLQFPIVKNFGFALFVNARTNDAKHGSRAFSNGFQRAVLKLLGKAVDLLFDSCDEEIKIAKFVRGKHKVQDTL